MYVYIGEIIKIDIIMAVTTYTIKMVMKLDPVYN